MKRTASETREKLILAATHVILAEGINQMTLESVAQAAGVSKGGLLYHFRSKDALIEGMVDYFLTRFEARLETHLANQPDRDQSDHSANAWLKAYIQASAVYEPEETAIGSALLAALTVNPALLKPLHERYHLWQSRLMQTTDPVLATLIRLTLDGLWLCDLTGLAPPDPALREQVLNRLLEMNL
jgi:AcrR family transcriptional regulator